MPKNSFADWDTTASNNTDIAGIDIQGTAAVQNFDNALRTLMAQLKSGVSGLTLDNTFSGANTFTATQTWAKGADVASATALTLGTDGNYFDITGTTSITSITTIGAGTVVKLHFDGILTLTHHATDLILPGGANITTTAGDEAEFVEYAAGDWRCVNYTFTSRSLIEIGTTQASTSGTSIDFTGIPPWVRRIVVMFDGVSLSGSASPLIQLGDSGGFETSGYVATSSSIPDGVVPSTLGSSAGFPLFVAGSARGVSGPLVFDLLTPASNKWVCGGTLTRSDASNQIVTGGLKALSATLDRIRITTTNGTDTFDGGNINVSWS